jgi:hypothetical protein
MYGTILDASFGTIKDSKLRLESFDDAFFGAVCSGKDLVGTAVATFASAIGSSIMAGHAAVNQIEVRMAGGSQVHSAFNAHVTMVTNGLTAFLFQLLLAPLFWLLSSYKSFSCGADSMLAIVANSGFEIIIGRKDLQSATSAVAGACLTSYASECTADVQQDGGNECFDSVASQTLSQLTSAFTTLSMEPMVKSSTNPF